MESEDIKNEVIPAEESEENTVENIEENIEDNAEADIEEKLSKIDTNFVFCVKCGKKNSGSHSFCTKCGSPLKKRTNTAQGNAGNAQAYGQYGYNNGNEQRNFGYTVHTQAQNYQAQGYQNQGYQPQNYQTQNYQVQINGVQNNQSREGKIRFDAEKKPCLMDYVRINCNYYETQFNKLDNTGKADFHVPAFLIGVFWLFYRKMYVEGAIFSIAVMIAVLIPYIGCFIAIGLCIALGINASKVYRLHLEKLVEEVNSLPENKRLMHIQKNGGTLF